MPSRDHWTCSGADMLIQPTPTLSDQERILAALSHRDITLTELGRETGIKREPLKLLLERMITDEEIHRLKAGGPMLYRLGKRNGQRQPPANHTPPFDRDFAVREIPLGDGRRRVEFGDLHPIGRGLGNGRAAMHRATSPLVSNLYGV